MSKKSQSSQMESLDVDQTIFTEIKYNSIASCHRCHVAHVGKRVDYLRKQHYNQSCRQADFGCAQLQDTYLCDFWSSLDISCFLYNKYRL